MADLAGIAALAARVVAAAVEWRGSIYADDPGSELDPLRDAVEAFQAACLPRQLTWGQVPAGWEVQAPDGTWFKVTATHLAGGRQIVTMDGIGTWTRDPGGPVTARPGVPDYTDVAIAALGYPQVLEDGR